MNYSKIALLVAVALIVIGSFLKGETVESTAEQEIAKWRGDVDAYFQGRWLFKRHCQVCHGAYGKGDGEWVTDGWDVKPRNLRSGIFKYRSTPTGKLPTDDDLRKTIRFGLAGTVMPTFRNLPKRDMDVLINYIKHMSRKWRDPKNYATPVKIPDRPDWYFDTDAYQSHVENGEKLFTATCVACHGAKGKGDGPGAVALMDSWGDKIKPRDLTGGSFRRGDDPKAMFQTLVSGIDGTPMVSFREAFTDDQIWEVIAYIKTLKDKGAE